ncbi:hypothetical protein ANN_24974 [Periplaneta americana]|uniref:Uncharacterized protein n=1 Tax=Periplaneta americana TaxID=6978 RepID=A0ABQ8S0E3_PERAM|nr:hypothetical protein ANN_24974 [Periplaneta americana]
MDTEHLICVVECYRTQPMITNTLRTTCRRKTQFERGYGSTQTVQTAICCYDVQVIPRCDEQETLPHVLGFCHHGELLRINRHNTVRSLIASSMRQNASYELYDEVQRSVRVVAVKGDIKRAL